MPSGWENLEREILWSSSTATAEVPQSKALNPRTVTAEPTTEGCSYTGLHLNMNLCSCMNKKAGRCWKNTCLLNKTPRKGEKTMISPRSRFRFSPVSLFVPHIFCRTSVCFPLSSITVIMKTSHYTMTRWFNSHYRDISCWHIPMHDVP